jgi:hypothetical protein
MSKSLRAAYKNLRPNWSNIRKDAEQAKTAKYLVVLKCGYEIFCDTLEEANTSLQAYKNAGDNPKLIIRG